MNYCLLCGHPARFRPYSWGSAIIDGEFSHVTWDRLMCDQFPLHQQVPVIRPGGAGVEVVGDAERKRRFPPVSSFPS